MLYFLFINRQRLYFMYSVTEQIIDLIDLIFGVLTLLSAIFQPYHGDHRSWASNW